MTVLLISTAITAQDKATQNNHVKSSGTYFEMGGKTKKWSNSNGSNYTKANYKENNCESFVKMTSDQKTTVKIDYQIVNQKGKLTLKIVSVNGDLLMQKVFTTEEEGSFEVELEANIDYQIRFIGDGAKGSYKCQWTENKSNQKSNI